MALAEFRRLLCLLTRDCIKRASRPVVGATLPLKVAKLRFLKEIRLILQAHEQAHQAPAARA